MTDSTASPSDWWGAQRLRYNIGLVVAGFLAFLLEVVIGFTLLPPEALYEITIVTIFVRSIGGIVVIGLANVLYGLGPLSERIIRPADPGRYRRLCFGAGLWFSILLPFSLPAFMASMAVFHPSYWRQMP